eukprot:jgi/Mesvir1/19353/Mv10404-RA.1
MVRLRHDLTGQVKLGEVVRVIGYKSQLAADERGGVTPGGAPAPRLFSKLLVLANNIIRLAPCDVWALQHPQLSLAACPPSRCPAVAARCPLPGHILKSCGHGVPPALDLGYVLRIARGGCAGISSNVAILGLLLSLAAARSPWQGTSERDVPPLSVDDPTPALAVLDSTPSALDQAPHPAIHVLFRSTGSCPWLARALARLAGSLAPTSTQVTSAGVSPAILLPSGAETGSSAGLHSTSSSSSMPGATAGTLGLVSGGVALVHLEPGTAWMKNNAMAALMSALRVPSVVPLGGGSGIAAVLRHSVWALVALPQDDGEDGAPTMVTARDRASVQMERQLIHSFDLVLRMPCRDDAVADHLLADATLKHHGTKASPGSGADGRPLPSSFTHGISTYAGPLDGCPRASSSHEGHGSADAALGHLAGILNECARIQTVHLSEPAIAALRAYYLLMRRIEGGRGVSRFSHYLGEDVGPAPFKGGASSQGVGASMLATLVKLTMASARLCLRHWALDDPDAYVAILLVECSLCAKVRGKRTLFPRSYLESHASGLCNGSNLFYAQPGVQGGRTSANSIVRLMDINDELTAFGSQLKMHMKGCTILEE